MIKPDPSLARYLFEASNLDPEAFHVVNFKGEEEISRLYFFEIDLISEDPGLDFSSIINHPATLKMNRDGEFLPTGGIIIDFEQAGRNLDYEYTQYRAVLAPRLWRLTLNYQSRIFQNKSVTDIIKDVLDLSGFSGSDYKFDLEGTYDPSEYIAQYQETDLNFICRLMEHEGISFFFEHSETKETLVMTDKQDAFTLMGGKTEVPYMYRHRKVTGEIINQLVCREKLVPGTFVLNDYNYRTPNTDLKVESQINSDMPGFTYLYGQHYKDPGAGQRLVRVRNEEAESTRKVLHGEGDCSAFRAGSRFGLVEHYRSDLNEEYLLTRIEHYGVHKHVMDAAGMKEEDEDIKPYSNSFVCIPAGTRYRPPRITPVPKIHGIMTGTVVGDSDYAALDEFGRYRANIHFDLDKTGSRQIRTSQPYTGKDDAGFHLPTHPGTEMVWSAIDGDPDRPFAIASGPNPNNPTTVAEENNSQHIYRTTSKNLYFIEDRQGIERITFHTPKHNSLISLGAKFASNEGITATTEEKVIVHGGKGIGMHAPADGFVLSAWPEYGAGGIAKQLAGVMPLLTMIVSTATGKFIDAAESPFGKILEFVKTVNDIYSKVGVAVKTDKWLRENLADNEADKADAITKFFDKLSTPGMFITAQGGIDFVNVEGYTITTGGGYSLMTPGEVKITAADEIGISTGANLSMFARHGHVQMVSDSKDILAKAVDGNVVHRAKKGIVSSAGGPIFLKAGDVTDDLKRKTLGSLGKDILNKFKKKDTDEEKEYILPPTDQDARIQLNAKDGVFINGEQGPVIIQSDDKEVAIAGLKTAIAGENGVEIYDDKKQIELKVGQASILMKKDGTIEIKGTKILIDAKMKVDIKGKMITSEAEIMNTTKGKLVTLEASALNTIKGGLVKIN